MIQPNIYWHDSQEHEAQYLYVAFCELASAMLDYSEGALQCGYHPPMSCIATLRITLVKIGLAQFPIIHLCIRRGFSYFSPVVISLKGHSQLGTGCRPREGAEDTDKSKRVGFLLTYSECHRKDR